MARKAKPSLPLYVRIDPSLHDRLVAHVKHSGLSRQQIVEGALARLFDAVDREAHRTIAEGIAGGAK